MRDDAGVSPRAADPQLRDRLVATAARLLAEEGPGALTARRLAREAGTSTMALYTHFGGMEHLRAAVRAAGLAGLSAHLAAAHASDDPVADLAELGIGYAANALADPHVFRATFMEAPIGGELAAVSGAGEMAFAPLVAAVERCIAAGRFAPADPAGLATQLWIATHGTVTLQLAGLLEPGAAAEHLGAIGRALFAGFGDDPEAAARSVAAAGERFAAAGR